VLEWAAGRSGMGEWTIEARVVGEQFLWSCAPRFWLSRVLLRCMRITCVMILPGWSHVRLSVPPASFESLSYWRNPCRILTYQGNGNSSRRWAMPPATATRAVSGAAIRPPGSRRCSRASIAISSPWRRRLVWSGWVPSCDRPSRAALHAAMGRGAMRHLPRRCLAAIRESMVHEGSARA